MKNCTLALILLVRTLHLHEIAQICLTLVCTTQCRMCTEVCLLLQTRTRRLETIVGLVRPTEDGKPVGCGVNSVMFVNALLARSVNPRLIWLDCKLRSRLAGFARSDYSRGCSLFQACACWRWWNRSLPRLLRLSRSHIGGQGSTRDFILPNFWLFGLAGKTTFVKRHLTGEFEKKYERKHQLAIF